MKFLTLGPFRVISSHGRDVTPRSQKACGVLALLLDAPGLQRSRAVLQDRLWSDRGQEQGAASLRQALTEIRKAFGEDREVLRTDAQMVGLDPGRVEVDCHDAGAVARALSAGAIFLEGLDIRDAEFGDWLRDRRLGLEAGAGGARPASGPGLGRAAGRPVLVLSAEAAGAGLFAEHLVQAIAKGVSDLGAVEIRWDRAAPEPGGAADAYCLEVHERPIGDGAAIRLQLATLPAGTLCWQMTEILTSLDPERAGDTLARLINEGVDRTAAAFAGDRPFAAFRRKDDYFYTLHDMWQSLGRNPEKLIERFGERFAQEGRGVQLAWQAFLSCFVVGERRATRLDAVDVRGLVRRAIELEPHNPLVLALASHVHGFVLREFEVSHELAERSVRLDRTNIFGWAFLAVAKNNLGAREEAFTCITHARDIAGEGPHRFFVDSLAAMVASLSGHAREAIGLGETIHALHPDFAPPLRYLLASYLAVGDVERARITALRLRALEPDFETSLLAEPDYPVEPLRRSGLLDIRKLPKLL